MIADEQTHRLPESDADRRRVRRSLRQPTWAVRRAVSRVLKRVNRRYGALFAGEEPCRLVSGV